MGMQKTKLDTSPIIREYNTKYNPRNLSPVYEDGCCTTVVYQYPILTVTATIAFNGINGLNMIVLKNSATDYLDYWRLVNTDSPRRCMNAGSDGAMFTLDMSKLDDCYAYLVETGQIFFAGKNSIYYGYTNINDMPTA